MTNEIENLARRMKEEVNSTMIYCKIFCKCHNVSPAQHINKQNNEKKIEKKA
jgi:hypothetical protein